MVLVSRFDFVVALMTSQVLFGDTRLLVILWSGINDCQHDPPKVERIMKLRAMLISRLLYALLHRSKNSNSRVQA